MLGIGGVHSVDVGVSSMGMYYVGVHSEHMAGVAVHKTWPVISGEKLWVHVYLRKTLIFYNDMSLWHFFADKW
jgi:hypothetical protein